MGHYKDVERDLKGKLRALGQSLPGPFQAFQGLHKAASEAGALDVKTKELIALAIGVAARCEGCIVFHVRDAVRAGATREEVLETLGVAVMRGGGPAFMYAAQAAAALDEYAD